MNLLSNSFHFKYTWRSYQQQFLNNYQQYIEDDYLHVIAPPGSGKTVLGLEMIKRVDQKTLVLSPTLTIRNQWHDRMLECFVEDEASVAISYDVKAPAMVTFSTYQSLHSFYKNDLEASEEKLLAYFQETGVKTIVMDEAHHLKNEWWKPLFSLKKITGSILISLTATPPYDSDASEIAKYFDLCGPIDVEIGVPELVKEGNLCPHQDYIYLSEPEQEQIKYIITYREQLLEFVSSLQKNELFKELIQQHPFYTQTELHLEEIYGSPDFYSAILIYLHAAGVEIEKEKTALLGFEEASVTFPSFSYQWVELLLQPMLVSDRERYIDGENVLAYIEKQLRKIGAYDKNRVNLVGEKKLYRSLSQSPTKLKSIFEIVKMEAAHNGNELRLVILSDYIRKEFLNLNQEAPLSEINTLGVVPIFQYLRKQISETKTFNLKKSKLAVLSGSLIILHTSLVADLKHLVSAEAFSIAPVTDSEYLFITPTTLGKKEMTGAITQLFETGAIEVLIGTKSFLGEGWDAPAINTLILASFVGSFVMSNQMRGRAIRVRPSHPDKVANVWHLACVDPTSDEGGIDVALLHRRFDAFCGVSLEDKPYIENGADRLQLIQNVKKVSLWNEKMKLLSKERSVVTQRWNEAITSGVHLVRELKLKDARPSETIKQKRLYYKDVVKYSLIELGAVLLITLPELLVNNISTLLTKGVLYFFYVILGGIIMIFLPKTYKALKLYLQFGRRDKKLFKMATALKRAMHAKRIIETPEEETTIQVETHADGGLSCYLIGATAKESLQFVEYLQQIIDPVENPRYLITQSGFLRKKLGFKNYYTVPGIFAERKKDALLFFENFEKELGTATMVFTRNLEGRKLLLKARFHYLQDKRNVISKKALIWK
ncbi:DEAD/DEAH box helicase family protein [Cochleicola gelatinilyticus]|uniref:DEAD/DEAH box helicase n=1 Tax=Cochleicola gelatinilyticus TaxID=1763537 RepID=A0A167IZG4_9FLAO|nr:DEAD/DEAH box helicase family protein [Cochleicola gelatinilyticus]OAB80167.1 DEAD/DEAH box helicase [Cochleicola gelatinilyticus]